MGNWLAGEPMTHFLTFIVVLISVAVTLVGIWRFWHKRCKYTEDAYFATVLTIAGIGVFCLISYAIWTVTA